MKLKYIINKKWIYVLISIVLVTGVFYTGVYVGASRKPAVDTIVTVANPSSPATTDADFAPFWKTWSVLSQKSIYASKITDQARVWGAVSGLASSMGDPYTVFFPPDQNKIFNDTIAGEFGGIGAEIGMKENTLVIISPIKDSPAFVAGIKSGDAILKINGKDTSNMTVDQAIALIRGDKGTTVDLTIFRVGEKQTRDFKIVRDIVPIPTIDTKSLSNGIFVISLYSFSENSATLFNNALQSFVASGDHKLIVDLRGNPGGYLDSAVSIGGSFLDVGKVIVSEDFEGKQPTVIYRSRGPKIVPDNLQLVVLVDGGSASASEILSGALQENNVATLVGTQTFGKGSVQELVPITDTTSLKVTIARWLTPNGTSISEKGLTPDVVVPFTQKDADAKQDPQMDKAVQILQARP